MPVASGVKILFIKEYGEALSGQFSVKALRVGTCIGPGIRDEEIVSKNRVGQLRKQADLGYGSHYLRIFSHAHGMNNGSGLPLGPEGVLSFGLMKENRCK